MHFLPSGQLLVSVGDDMKGESAQDLDLLTGKILMVNPDAPFVAPTIMGTGLRNPTRVALSLDGKTLWITDVGNNCVEEVNRISLGANQAVTNFGWPHFEGKLEHDFKDSNGVSLAESETDARQYVMPITTYAHKDGACAVIGGAILAEWFIFADYCDGIIRGLPIDAAPDTKAAQLYDMSSAGTRVGIFGISSDRFGRVWVLDGWGGAIYQLEVAP